MTPQKWGGRISPRLADAKTPAAAVACFGAPPGVAVGLAGGSEGAGSRALR